MASQAHPFPPLIDEHSKVLVLGTFPSLQSISNTFYYGNPRNQFWKLLASCFDCVLDTNKSKENFCKDYHIALWDIYAYVTREHNNSSDQNLKETKVNDIPKLLKQYPQLQQIFFTSKKAYVAYKKKFDDLDIPLTLLPSPSPAYAVKSFEEKLEIYKKDFYYTVSNLKFKKTAL